MFLTSDRWKEEFVFQRGTVALFDLRLIRWPVEVGKIVRFEVAVTALEWIGE